MKLWVDDIREPPLGWAWAKTSQEAINALAAGAVSEMSLDHDLGEDDTTRKVVLWLCENEEYWPDTTHVHTANPVGLDWLVGMIKRYGKDSYGKNTWKRAGV